MQNHVFGIVVSYLQRRLVIRVHLDYGIWYLIMEFNNFIHFLGYTKSPGLENKPLLLVPVQLHLTTYTAMLSCGWSIQRSVPVHLQFIWGLLWLAATEEPCCGESCTKTGKHPELQRWGRGRWDNTDAVTWLASLNFRNQALFLLLS